ncbi:MAG: type II secretion system GspH family protein [Oligoflexia bacterium]|nr:type II secretion system GspH family protein [Oligoflexia bacterium]
MTRQRRESGFTLIELLIAFGVLGAISLIMLSMMTNLQSEVKRLRDKSDRTLSSYYIDQIVTNQDGVRTSADLLPANADLKACVLGGASGSCTSNCCVGGQAKDFILLDPRDLNPDPAARARLSGTTATPLAYAADGTLCQSGTCAYTIGTSFTARCPGGVSSCDHAEHLIVNIFQKTLGVNPLIKSQDRSLIYFVNLNYQPFLAPIADQSISLGSSPTINVYGNSGHPSEVQNFLFDTCVSSAPAIVRLTCYGFVNGMGSIKIEGLQLGTANITLTINDAGSSNNISPPSTFTVTVIP